MSLKLFFGAEVCRARIKLGYTQVQVAEAANITVRTVQYIEKGEHMPGHALMLRLLIVLKMDPELFREEVQAHEPLPRGKRRIAAR